MDARNRFLDGLKKQRQPPRVVFFAEHHQTDAFRTKFTEFFFNCAAELCPEPFNWVFVELRHDSMTDLQCYFDDQLGLIDYRTRWIKPGSMMSVVPDTFFENLKSLRNSHGISVIALNKADPDRDLFMRDKILESIGASMCGLVWVGAGHALRRPVNERKDWRSCLELLETDKVACLSVVECSRRLLLDDRIFDYRLEKLLDRNDQVAIDFTSQLGNCAGIVTETLTIGVDGIFPEFDRDTIYLRFRNYDGVFLDPERFLTAEEEERRRGNPADFSNCK